MSEEEMTLSLEEEALPHGHQHHQHQQQQLRQRVVPAAAIPNTIPASVLMDKITCPISHQIMADPVLLHPSGITFDRIGLCRWLIKHPFTCPFTNVTYDERLYVTDNVALRDVLTSCLGDEAYQPHRDPNFERRYDYIVQHKLTTADTRLPASNFQDYEEFEALIFGMGRRQIDVAGALSLIENELPQDAVTEAFKALHLHPRFKLYGSSLVRKDENEARQSWTRALELGLEEPINQDNMWAQCAKAIYYSQIEGRHVLAADLCALAAAQGQSFAQLYLGFLYDNGQGVQQSDSEAFRLYILATEQGNAEAQTILAVMHDDGRGVQQSDSEAVLLYQLAAAQNHAPAQCNLGPLYEDGKGVDQDHYEAARLYGLAAAQNYAPAQCNLARLHQIGRGVKQDVAEATRLYRLAAAQGYESAVQALAQMGEDTTLINWFWRGQAGLLRAFL